jgi:hypothetical protein
MFPPVCIVQKFGDLQVLAISKSVARQRTRNGKMSTLNPMLDIHAWLTFLLTLQAQETFARALSSDCSLSLYHILKQGWRLPTRIYAMVLLTSSSISVIISSGVVFLFTFLLFLSGYVVQQQTLRSLQAALHPPPMPSSTLPVYFQKEHESELADTANSTAAVEGGESDDQGEVPQETTPLGFQTVIKSEPEPTAPPHSKDEAESQPPPSNEPVTGDSSAVQPTMQSAIIEGEVESSRGTPTSVAPAEPEPLTQVPVRLAYAQLLSNPSQICSALLFFKLQMDYGDADISRVILYPSRWEEDTSSEAFSSVLALMRLVKEEYKITYLPIGIGNASEQRRIERELVSHLATDHWEYDRIMYLRSPGLALNIAALDSALQGSKTKTSLSRNWAPVNPGASTAPSILLVSDQEMQMPRGSNRRLTAEAITSHANHHENEMDVEAAAQTAAYVYFEEGELEHRKTEKEWYGGVFERYERGRAEICRGISFDEGRTELKKVRKRG